MHDLRGAKRRLEAKKRARARGPSLALMPDIDPRVPGIGGGFPDNEYLSHIFVDAGPPRKALLEVCARTMNNLRVQEWYRRNLKR